MRGQSLWLALLGLLVVGALIYWLLRAEEELAAPVEAPAATDQPTTPAAATDEADEPAPAPADMPARHRGGVERIDAETRARLLRHIGERLAERAQRERARAAAGDETGAGGDEPPSGHLDREYIQARVRDIVPLIKECYEMSLADQPDLNARIVVSFTISGDEELGGLVTESTVKDEAAQHPALAECVRETMYAIRMDAPEGGGVVKVTYPFIFRSAPAEDSAE